MPWNKEKYEKVAINTFRSLEKGIDPPEYFVKAHAKDIKMEEIPVSESSELVNVPLKDSGIRQNFNLIIIAIKKPDGKMLFNPSFEAAIMPKDTVIAVGELDNLQKLEKLLNP